MDDALTVYACNHDAALITHDVEFSMRRRRNVIGRHIFLRCNEWDGIAVIKQDLDGILPVLDHHADVWLKLSLGNEPDYSYTWQ